MQRTQGAGAGAPVAAPTTWSTAGPLVSSERRVLVPDAALLLCRVLIPLVVVAAAAGLLVPDVYRDARLFMLADGQPFDVPLSVVFSVWTAATVVLAWRFLSSISPPGLERSHP